jgi:predicted small secreted protein
MRYQTSKAIAQVRRWLWMLITILALSCSVVLTACANCKATAGNELQSVSIASTDSHVSKDGKVAEIKR